MGIDPSQVAAMTAAVAAGAKEAARATIAATAATSQSQPPHSPAPPVPTVVLRERRSGVASVRELRLGAPAGGSGFKEIPNSKRVLGRASAQSEDQEMSIRHSWKR